MPGTQTSPARARTTHTGCQVNRRLYGGVRARRATQLARELARPRGESPLRLARSCWFSTTGRVRSRMRSVEPIGPASAADGKNNPASGSPLGFSSSSRARRFGGHGVAWVQPGCGDDAGGRRCLEPSERTVGRLVGGGGGAWMLHGVPLSRSEATVGLRSSEKRWRASDWLSRGQPSGLAKHTPSSTPADGQVETG